MRSAEFADLVAVEHGLDRVDLDSLCSGTSLASEFSTIFLQDLGLYPYRTAGGEVRLATGDPSQRGAIDAIVLSLGKNVALNSP